MTRNKAYIVQHSEVYFIGRGCGQKCVLPKDSEKSR